MAITPRSFGLNPRLLLLAAIAAGAFWMGVQLFGNSCRATAAVDFGTCTPTNAPMTEWEPWNWGAAVDCLSVSGDLDKAYQAASLAVLHHPRHRGLLNLRGLVAARNSDYATAIYDFRTGQRITGSPQGVFENNIAWTTLFQTSGLSPERAERVLLQTRALSAQSLSKGTSCERQHTALFVEYAIADHVARAYGRTDIRVSEAVNRYVQLYGAYAPCLTRASLGNEMVVEELVSAAAMDARMGTLAGIDRPTRHIRYARSAVKRASQLGLQLDREWCDRTVPVDAAIDTCEALVSEQ